MSFLLATHDGLFEADERGFERVGLAGRRVTHVARRGERVLAAVPRAGVFALEAAGERCVWSGDARSCAIGPGGALYAGAEPAMVFRCEANGPWQRCDAIDALPTRSSWSFPPPPHQPHVLSIDFLPGEPTSVLAGIEVGGVILSRDAGRSWCERNGCERNSGIYVDVHSVRPDPLRPGRWVAVTGKGLYATENAGESWELRMKGVPRRYTVGLHLNPAREGEILLAAGEGPPGLYGRVYHSLDAGESWTELEGIETQRVAVPFFAFGCAWLALDTGDLLRASDARGAWSRVHRLPAAINAVAADGSPSSVMH